MIRIACIAVFLLCQLFASNKIKYNVSFEYWMNENLKIFSVNNVIVLEIEDDGISVTSNNWFGKTLLNESIKYENQSILEKNIFNKTLLEKVIYKEDSWIEGYSLLNNKKIKVRYLFSAEEDSSRLYRMDIKELNKNDDANKINDVILDSDVIMIWTNLDKEIKKISVRYNGSNYVIKLNDE